MLAVAERTSSGKARSDLAIWQEYATVRHALPCWAYPVQIGQVGFGEGDLRCADVLGKPAAFLGAGDGYDIVTAR